MPLPSISAVSHSPSIAFLEYRGDVLAKKVTSALGRILAAMPRHSRLGEIVGASALDWCDHLAFHKLSEFPETAAPIASSRKRKKDGQSEWFNHDPNFQDEPLFALKYEPTLYEESSDGARRLRKAGCSTQMRRAWDYILAPTVEHKTFGFGAARHYRLRRSDRVRMIVVGQGRERRTLLLDAAFWVSQHVGCLPIKTQSVKNFIFPDGSPETPKGIPQQVFSRCLECGTAYVDAEGKRTLSQFEFCGETPLTMGDCKKAWLKKHPHRGPVQPKFADALSLADYAARHRDDEAVTLPHLTRRCDVCRMAVTALHNSEKCAAKMLTDQQAVAELQTARREARRQRSRAALIAQGLYSPEAFDVGITRAKCGTVEAEAITKFDRDLSRKGNKYRIR